MRAPYAPVMGVQASIDEREMGMAKQSAEAPSATTVPGALHDIDLMARDSKRFRDTGNWGYTQYNYDPAKATFTALEPGSKCGFACHTTVAAKDYVFTAYGPR